MLFRSTTWGLGASSNKGTPELQFRFEILGKIDPNDPEGALIPCPNYERTIYRYLTQATHEFVVDDLEFLGYDKGSFKFLDPHVEGAHSFAGQEFNARCDHEDYQGQPKERWSFARRRGPAEIAPLESEMVRKLDAMFGKSLSRLKKAKPAAKAEAKQIPGATQTSYGQHNEPPKISTMIPPELVIPPPRDEDIPF